MMSLAMMGLISMPVTFGLPLATARSTSTPPPGPMMAKSPCGRRTFATEGAADIGVVPIVIAPVMRIGVHQERAGIGVDHDRPRVALVIDLDARERVPARIDRRDCASCPSHKRCRSLVMKVAGDQHQEQQRRPFLPVRSAGWAAPTPHRPARPRRRRGSRSVRRQCSAAAPAPGRPAIRPADRRHKAA